MLTCDNTWFPFSVVAELRRRARLDVARGLFPEDKRYLDRCTAWVPGWGIVLVLTRDTNHHISGWWKNPDYERCWHLSISQRDPITANIAPRSTGEHDRWVCEFFREDARSLWSEAPYSPVGKKFDVWHYRLFVQPDWETVIVPRGEVYSKEFTELGWLSYSDLRDKQAKEKALLEEQAGQDL